ncbi:MAG: hydroxyacid dehydrogenase [Verrucomicrobia bacterium]|nr:hydroxyacid dehydrogenase [Verrucomicrobiota bacterium]
MDILIPEELTTTAVDRLNPRYRVVSDGGLWKDREKLRLAVSGARALMVRNQTQVTAKLLSAAPNLLAVGRLGVGLDNIDVEAASRLGIVVIAPLDANAPSVAELTMAFILALARKIPLADRSTKAGGWDRKGCMGIELEGKTLAICGFGRIGRLVARRARAFGLRILVFDPFVNPGLPEFTETQARHCARLEEALGEADFVSVHSPFTPETKRMFNARTFEAMKPGAFFINTSRGGIVDETALLRALESGHLAGAALDVREVEPPAGRAGFEALENVLLTPHIGAATTEAQTRTFETVAEDIDRVLRGESAMNFVNFARPKR